MRIAIFSDIHGNRYAFAEIYKRIKAEACDIHLYLGDVCGYYYGQNEVLDTIRQLPGLHAVTGNHDALFLEAVEDDEILAHYTLHFGRSFELLKENITSANLAFLRGLPEKIHIGEYGIGAYHGSPWRPISEYIYPDAPLERFRELPFSVVFLGHTHYCMNREVKDMRVVNPGSAGQPRDGNWPSYAVYDTVTGEVEIKAVAYNVKPLIEDIKRYEEKNQYLIDVLLRVRNTG